MSELGVLSDRILSTRAIMENAIATFSSLFHSAKSAGFVKA
ncbi:MULTISPECIES: hypothetical protein [Cyanophyceae]|nr:MULTISPECIES: hypothetical protein [unclassified Trichocoleus]